MGRTYGKIRKKTVRKPRPPAGDIEPLKIKLRGKDNAPLSMTDIKQGLYDAARQLLGTVPQYRAKWATLYVSIVDENGNEVQLNAKNELVIYPYKSAADEY